MTNKVEFIAACNSVGLDCELFGKYVKFNSAVNIIIEGTRASTNMFQAEQFKMILQDTDQFEINATDDGVELTKATDTKNTYILTTRVK